MRWAPDTPDKWAPDLSGSNAWALDSSPGPLCLPQQHTGHSRQPQQAVRAVSQRFLRAAVTGFAMHLLLVEDDPALAAMLRRLLESDRHVVEAAATGEEALEVIDAQPALDAIILDLMLPGITGTEVIRRVRGGGSAIPIVILTARDTVEDRVAGLDAGGDDYVVKPFAYEELVARLRSVARRGSSRPAGAILRCGPIALDERSRQVTVSGQQIELTGREFSLLECLLRHRGQVLSREQLLDHAWPLAAAVTLNSVDAYVHYLRSKLGEAGQFIRTVRGTGYRLTDE